MLAHTGLLSVLSAAADVELWASSATNPRYRNLWAERPVAVRELPAVEGFRELWHNYPRRVNERVWDLRQRDPSRLSLARHRPTLTRSPLHRALSVVAVPLAALRLEHAVESLLERRLLSYERCGTATHAFRAAPPDVVVTTGPYQYEQPAIAAAALREGIRTLALIPSWDNISTKSRMLFKYDGYLVWSERMREELHERYPHTRTVPVYVIGAPQFDVFYQERFRQSREHFCAGQGLRSDAPIVVYAIGSPNFLVGEPHGALAMARCVARGELGDAQLLVRPHPIHDNADMDRLFAEFGPAVRVQRTSPPGTPLTARSQDDRQIREWVNTFRHADVVVNLSSTVTVDAALCDRPVVNLDFDPGPGGADSALVKDINHVWTHFKPVAESGGVWLVDDVHEMIHATRTYLARPELHREQRRAIVRHVCQYADGRSGGRMAQAILDFAAIAHHRRGHHA